MEFYKIPDWVNNLVNIEELTLQQIDLTSLRSISNLPLTRINLKAVSYKDLNQTVLDFKNFSKLKTISFDASVEMLVNKLDDKLEKVKMDQD